MTQPIETCSEHQPAGNGTVWSRDDLSANPHGVPDKAQRVQRMFGAIAGRYDLNNRVHSFGLDQVWRRKLVRLCEIRPTDRVLDVACGTGDLAMAFAKAGCREVIGVDFTPEMLRIARHKAQTRRSRSVTPPSYVQGDAMQLPFEDGRFDVVSIAFGIRNVADPSAALREFHRVLRPGGRLAVLEFSQPRNAIVRWFNNLYTQRIMPLSASLLAGDRSGAYRYLPRSILTFADQNEMCRMIAACGFDAPRVQRMSFEVCAGYIARRHSQSN